MKKTSLMLLVLIAALALSACAAPASIETPPSDQGTSELDCPSAATGTQSLRNDELGFCLLYPEGYTEILTEPAQICLIPGKPGEPNMACHSANAFINVEPANGRTAGEAADQIIAESSLTETFERTDLTIAGEAAVMLDGLGGVDINRKVVIVHADRVYTLMFIPWDSANEDWPRIEALHNTVLDSFTFLP